MQINIGMKALNKTHPSEASSSTIEASVHGKCMPDDVEDTTQQQRVLTMDSR